MLCNADFYFLILFIILSAAVANISMYFVFVIVANLYVTVTDSNKSNNTALQCTSPEVSEMIYRVCMQSEL